jgi:hypothetical protein
MQESNEPMTELTFEQLRIPAALILIIVAVFVFLPRGTDGQPAAATASPDPSASSGPIVGEPGGGLIGAADETPIPTLTPLPSPDPTRTPRRTPRPAANDGFQAQVLACRSTSGSSCNGQLGTLPAGAGTFTALVLFSNATAGDTINVVLSGPGGTTSGSPFTLGGGGDGYFYSTIPVGGLPGGEYTLVATRNGDEVAVTSFQRGGR